MKTAVFVATLIAAITLGQAGIESMPERTSGVILFEVAGLASDKGQVRCGLFDSQQNWLKEKDAIGRDSVAIENGVAVCVFENRAPGDYGIAAHHDRPNGFRRYRLEPWSRFRR